MLLLVIALLEPQTDLNDVSSLEGLVSFFKCVRVTLAREKAAPRRHLYLSHRPLSNEAGSQGTVCAHHLQPQKSQGTVLARSGSLVAPVL